MGVRMKVLHALNELKPSGAEMMLKTAAAHWRSFGVDCDVLSTGTVPGVFSQDLKEAGYKVHHIPFRKRIGFFRELHGLLRKGGYDILHQHAERACYPMAITALSAGAGVVRTVHSSFSHRGIIGLRKILQQKHLLRLGVRFVTIGKGVQENERLLYRTDSARIDNWVDCSRFVPPDDQEREISRRKMGVVEGEFVIVTVGNCAPVKNHRSLIDALARWCGEGPPFRYLHVGQEDDARSELRQAEALGIADRVRFCGWMAPREALAAADLFIMPSLYEGMSIAALEALAMGLPALVGNSPGLRDLPDIFDGVSLCDVSSEGLLTGLRKFAASRGHTPSNGPLSGNFHVAVEKFGVERGVRQYAELYRSMCRSPVEG